ncbi:TnpV protein [Hominenteromicrobium sp.]|uniref:TnpV protein n=1 Tax=Hominenteromicrobium sp. TaxID=3073581 RepID=UPI003AF0F346
MADAEGITETLKANDQMEWVGRMNSCRDRASETVYHQVIYTGRHEEYFCRSCFFKSGHGQ